MDNFSLSEDEALSLCVNVRKQNRNKWWSYKRWWCWGCVKFSKNPSSRCFKSDDGKNSGCPQINHLKQNSMKEKSNKIDSDML